MKITTIIGARPQFIKAGALSREFRKHDEIQETIIHTGQHFDKNMSDVFFHEMEIPKPDYNLNINSMNHGGMTGRMLEEIEKIFIKEMPDCVLVYGDTNSTLAGALAASKIHIPVIHIEAGLRSFNMKMPEEINRILTDRISKILFCPTENAVNNLKNEGFDNFDCSIYNVGDVMLDAAMYYSAQNKSNILQYLNIKEDYYLCTIHRAENTNNTINLKNIVAALNEISKSTQIVLPLHPRTKNILSKLNFNLNISHNLKIIPPVGYFDMLALLKNCKLVLTDSGGLQKEAYYFNKYCITLREQTEWIELIEQKVNVITGANYDKIITTEQEFSSKSFPKINQLYGNGLACYKICKILLNKQ